MPVLPAERPRPVIAIALFQFAKALILSGIALVAWLATGTVPVHDVSFLAVFYIAAHGSSASGLPVAILAVYSGAAGAYCLVVGWGLWNLKQWARNLLLSSTGITLALWARSILFEPVIGWRDFRDPRAVNVILVFLFFDLLVFLNLFLNFEVKRVFHALDD